jgi:NADPH-dependent 2,4-dienoyl-CoA reductase/sulfur reductase-like enzyme
LVIIGGDAAGMSAAAQVRRMKTVDELEIVVFERSSTTSYAACGLPYLVGGFVTSPHRLVARTPEQHRAKGIDAKGVLQLRTLDDAAQVEQLLASGARRAVVVGAGYIGLEVAEGLLKRGLHVTVIERLDAPMGAVLDADMAADVADAMRAAGIDLRLGTAVTGFKVDGARVCAVETAAGSFEADIVVIGLGVRPNAELARTAGIGVGEAGGIKVDDHLRTDSPHIWAAGDCVESHHRISGRSVVVALGTHANKQGRVVGTNIAGGDAAFRGVLGTAITRFQDTEIARTGLTEREAAAGSDVLGVTTEASSPTHYYPDAQPMKIKLVVERGTGRLLGAQIVGGAGAGKRIDVLATALWSGMTVAEVAEMDLSYAPPFSPVWDPVLLAAGKAAARV